MKELNFNFLFAFKHFVLLGSETYCTTLLTTKTSASFWQLVSLSHLDIIIDLLFWGAKFIFFIT